MVYPRRYWRAKFGLAFILMGLVLLIKYIIN